MFRNQLSKLVELTLLKRNKWLKLRNSVEFIRKLSFEFFLDILFANLFNSIIIEV